MEFNFGQTATSFQHDRPIKALAPRLQKQLDATKAELASSKAELAASKSDYAKLQASQDTTNQRLQRMEEELFNKVGQLEQELADSKNEQRSVNLRLTEVEKEHAQHQKAIKSKDAQLEQQAADLETLRAQLHQTRGDFTNEKNAHASTDEHLQKAYADIEARKIELKAVQDERDKAQELGKDHEVKLQSLHKQWGEDQDKLQELDTQLEALSQLEEQSKGLQEDAQEHLKHSEEKDHLLQVKDARIGNLEDQLQRALASVRSSEAAAETTKLPHEAPPTAHISAIDNLHHELSGVDDATFDAGSEYDEQVEFIGVIESATIDIAPVESVLMTAAGSTQTEPKPTTMTADESTQTEEPKPTTMTADGSTQTEESKTTTMTASMQNEPPKVTSMTRSTQTEELKITTATPSMQTEPPKITTTTASMQTEPEPPKVTSMTRSTQTEELKITTATASMPTEPPKITTTTASMQTEPPKLSTTFARTEPATVETASAQTESQVLCASAITTVHTTPIGIQFTPPVIQLRTVPKKSIVWPLLSAVLTFLCAYLWMQLRAWESANLYYPSSSGAYGNPVHFLGIIPVGWDIGESYFSEAITRNMAGALQAFETWAGVDRALLY